MGIMIEVLHHNQVKKSILQIPKKMQKRILQLFHVD